MKLITSMLALLVGWSLFSAEYYVRSGAQGNHSGTDWTNAFPDLPSVLERGSAYYLASGTYGPYVFDDAEIGNLVVTILKATPNDHGTDIGWFDSYADGQAVFTDARGPIATFRRGYYRIDGQTGDADSGHGIKLYNPANLAAYAGGCCLMVEGNTSAKNLTLEHIEMESAGWAGTVVPAISRALYAVGETGDFVMRSCYIHHAGQEWALFANPSPNFLIEKCYFSKGGSGDRDYHSVGLWIRESTPNMNIVIRNNVFEDFSAAGGTGYISLGWRPTKETQTYSSGYEICGNIFRETSPLAGPSRAIGSNGSNGGPIVSDVRIYNNTFFGLTGLSGGSILLANPGENNFAANNLWFGCVRTPVFANIEDVSNFKNTGDNPFVDTMSLRLSGPLPGFFMDGTIVDMDGSIRGADGIWDIGAYEYVAHGNRPPELSPVGSKSTSMGHTLQFQINASDPDDDPLTFSASGG